MIEPINLSVRRTVLISQIQTACQHKHVDQWPAEIDDKDGVRHQFFMRQCADCLMFNP